MILISSLSHSEEITQSTFVGVCENVATQTKPIPSLNKQRKDLYIDLFELMTSSWLL